MTNLSEVKYLPEVAEQSIAPTSESNPGAMYANARMGCGSSADLQTDKPKNPFPTHHDPKQTRLFSMAVVEICEDCYEAAAWLQQLSYWESRATVTIDGVRWIKDSGTDLEKQMRFKRRTVEKVNRLLLRAGFIEIEVRPWKGYKYKSPTRHYRITEKARPYLIPLVQNVQVVEAVEKAKGKPLVQNVPVVSKAYVQNVPVTENIKSTEKKEKTKPVDEKTSTACFESNLTTGETSQKQNQPLTEVKKPRKLLAWGKTFDEAVAACHGAPKVALPKEQQEIANHNLKLMCRRMLDAQYTPDQVHEFLRWAGGMGWYDLRTEWGSHWHPDTHEKEQVGFRPDIDWLVGNPKKGTGAHRLEAALSIWEHHTDQHPQEQQPAEQQEQPATPLAKSPTTADLIMAKLAAKGAQITDTRLSVADAWELTERSSSLTPLIQSWRSSVAAGVPVPNLEKYLRVGEYQGPTAEYLEIALALMPPVDPEPEPEPEPAPVECLVVVQADCVSPAHALALCLEDYDEAPVSQDAQLAALAKWLPQATAQHQVAEAAKKAAEAKRKFTASANPYWPPKGKAPLHQHGNASLTH